MKPWRTLLAVALAALALLLLTSLVFAAPSSTAAVQTSQVFDSPILTDTVPIVTETVRMTHPVGIAIALYFNKPYTQVMSLHEQGWGFGNIARVYLTAAASQGALTPEQVMAMRQAGAGWGEIKKEYGVHPGGNGLGSIMSKKPVASQPEPAAPAPPEVKFKWPGAKPDKNASGCPGNSCTAPGQQNPPKGKPTRAPNK